MSFGSQILHAYLFAYIYWLMIPLGCTAILMMHHLTGGWWGYPIRRLLEAGTRTFGVMALLFVPDRDLDEADFSVGESVRRNGATIPITISSWRT